MVEVFKTNVRSRDLADLLLAQIHLSFAEYTANFDLWDCDNILRVKGIDGAVQPLQVIGLLNDFGVEAEVLPDEVPQFLPDLLQSRDTFS